MMILYILNYLYMLDKYKVILILYKPKNQFGRQCLHPRTHIFHYHRKDFLGMHRLRLNIHFLYLRYLIDLRMFLNYIFGMLDNYYQFCIESMRHYNTKELLHYN